MCLLVLSSLELFFVVHPIAIFFIAMQSHKILLATALLYFTLFAIFHHIKILFCAIFIQVFFG